MSRQQHKVSGVDPQGGLGTCLVCGPEVEIQKDHRGYYVCAFKRRESRRENARKNYDSTRNKWSMVKYRYKLSEAAFWALLGSQGDRCAVCGTDTPTNKGWCIDHDRRCCPDKYTCGECVRGILCSNCNTALGLFKDDVDALRSAIQYLQ
jgi:hypothetical protein